MSSEEIRPGARYLIWTGGCYAVYSAVADMPVTMNGTIVWMNYEHPVRAGAEFAVHRRDVVFEVDDVE